MVKLVIKRGDQVRFTIDVNSETMIDDLIKLCAELHNSLLKIERICAELEELAEHGVTMPPNMQGLNEEQISELKLKDDYLEKCTPSGGYVERSDDMRRRNGRAPIETMAKVLMTAAKDAKDMVSRKCADQNKDLTKDIIKDAMSILTGSVMIVFPMGLPPYDPIRMEFDNEEELAGTQAEKEVIAQESATLWFCGKELLKSHKLSEYSGKNEKTKIVVKLSKVGHGPPAREPVVNEADQRAMMAFYHRKQEEWKKLEEKNKDDDSYLDSPWADNNRLKREFHGLNNVKWGPR
ncbi:hypothetical protein Ciccas_000703 [Cichlidogyrus casuarinus]|uniref:Uncharacterized protein n=1 Tax=Cichlidogyrus casuarinus TaxID=1844966 RepID=A0ABD2QM81_9PLAT